MTSTNKLSLRPGEIRLDFIPLDWPLTPLGARKDPYIAGWQGKPFDLKEIEEEILSGDCKAIGVLGGPAYNNPYGLVWVDIDGPTVYTLVKELADETDFDKALPPTLTICSGKLGRERKLYKLSREKHKHFVRNKYTWHGEGAKEKLEILWSRHQGVLMGLHPETDGYYTAEGQGFEWCDKLPDVPDWLLNAIINKNVKQGIPAKETKRIVGPGFAINTEISLDRDIQLGQEAMWSLPIEACDDYDIWITIGQTLHSTDESLLDAWDEWSKQSEKYQEGECHRRWLSFSKGGGRGLGSLIHIAQEHGWQPSQDHRAMSVDDAVLEQSCKLLEAFEKEVHLVNQEVVHEEKKQQDSELVFDTSPLLSLPGLNMKTGKDQKTKNASSDILTHVVRQLYNGNLRFSQEQGTFFLYEHRSPGLWSQVSDHEVRGSIKNKFESVKGELLRNGYGMNLINDVLEQLRIVLIFDGWYEGNDLLLFTNGILDVQTRELRPFERGLFITQQLPYPYNPGMGCELIIKWLKSAQDGSWHRVQVLRAWLRAVLLSRSDIQKFVEIVGPGKSGKSTYANLAHALVGDDNAMISSLEHLEKNRFETSNLYKKKLLLFNDVERYGGSVSVLKALTGRDLIRNERKFQTGSQKPFKFNGLVMITANEPIQTTDPTSGLARRRLTIPFNNVFSGSSAEQKTLIDMDDRGRPFGEFAHLLPGLVNWVLDMSEAEMREYLMETNSKVKFFATYHREQILKSNQIMDWLHHCVIFDVGVTSVIGLAKYEAGKNTYENHNYWLYASYCEFSRSSNSNVLGRSRFESLLMDVCMHQLKLNVYQVKTSRGMLVKNISCRGRDPKYEKYPTIVEVGLNKEEWRVQYGDVLDRKTDAKIENEAVET